MPVELLPPEITRNGLMTIKFNQKLIVPSFITKRKLISVDQLDVTRDVLDLKFIVKSDIDPTTIKYYLHMREWTENHLKIFINFTDPFQIS